MLHIKKPANNIYVSIYPMHSNFFSLNNKYKDTPSLYTRICYIALKKLVCPKQQLTIVPVHTTIENTSEFHSHDSFVCGLDDRFFFSYLSKLSETL